MRYLPELSGYTWDPFWKDLVQKIKVSICDENLIFLWGSLVPVKLDHARRLPSRYRDKDLKPLFADLPAPQASYISPAYNENDRETLIRFGLRALSRDEFLARVKLDLSDPSTSKMQDLETSDDWHSRVAWILGSFFDRGFTRAMKETRQLDLIPLTCNVWCNSWESLGRVFFPETADGVSIPSDIDLEFVDPNAFTLQNRKALFRRLGITYASIEEVRDKIMKEYDNLCSQDYCQKSLGHLR